MANNADKYGPFGCVWIRQCNDGNAYEFVLTDSTGQIVWIRRMGRQESEIFGRQFVFDYPATGLWDCLGAEPNGWRQVFPALLAPRELRRDLREWLAVARVAGTAWANAALDLQGLSLEHKKRSWLRLMWSALIPYRPGSLSDAQLIGVPGLTVESRDAYISKFGLDREPRGYEEALAGGKLVAANAPW